MEVLCFPVSEARTGTDAARACVCASEQCKQLSKGFREQNDVRGLYTSFPKELGENDTRKTFAATQKKLAQRYRIHLNLRSTVETIDNRNRSKMAPVTTRNASNEPKQSKKQVANHHFHPKVINSFLFDRNKSTFSANKMLPIEDVRRLLQPDTHLYFTNIDRLNDEKYLNVLSFFR